MREQEVAREVHDLRRDRHPVGQPKGRKIARQELRAAADVRPRELRAVAVHRVVGLTDVARIVKERDYDAHHRALSAKPLLDRV